MQIILNHAYDKVIYTYVKQKQSTKNPEGTE